MSEDRNRPLEILRDGALRASIWENSRDGQTSHSVQFRRSYRDQGGQVRDTDSFFAADLLRLAHLATQSHDRLNRLVAPIRDVLGRHAPGIVVAQIVDQAFDLVSEVAHGAQGFAIGKMIASPELEQGADRQRAAGCGRGACQSLDGRKAVCLWVWRVVAFGALKLLLGDLTESPVGFFDQAGAAGPIGDDPLFRQEGIHR